MGGKEDDISIVKAINKNSFTTLTFLKFLFCEWFVAFNSLICIINCKLLIEGVVIYLNCNDGLP